MEENVKLKIVSLLGLLILSTSLLNAEKLPNDINVQAEGYGTTKNDALLKAKRGAVETGIGTVLVSETEVKNFELQKDIILSRTIGSVKKYQVLKEAKQPDNVFYVKIDAMVSLASIKADLAALKILLESMDKPRMMVVIREENGKTAENAVLEYLTEKGFDLVDPAVVAALMQTGDRLIQRAAEGDPAAAARIGVSNGAEYVLVGKVTKSLMNAKAVNDLGMISGQAHITARLVNCSNARVIASKSANSAAVHTSEDVAMAKATEKAGKKLMDRALFEKIVSSFQDMVNNGITIDVTVKNVTNYKMQKSVRKVIGALSEVVSVNKRSFGGGQLKLSVLYKGNADMFSDSVDGKTVGKKTLSVTGVTGSKVIIEIE
jgi:predicted nucleic acid-binding protein